MIELSDSNEEEVRGVREGVRYEKGEMMLLIGCHTFCCWGARGWGVLKVSTASMNRSNILTWLITLAVSSAYFRSFF